MAKLRLRLTTAITVAAPILFLVVEAAPRIGRG
jgi:hypothetical protein